ncbi:MAG: DUF5606 domain-containing protein [Bacteroidia bacterium]|jgi:hypothetical protein
MDLKDIVSIAGIGGLHKIIGKTKAGLIVESFGDSPKRFATGIQDKVSILEDISMYTQDGDMPLAEVLTKLNERGDVPTSKEAMETQRKFLIETINLDSERVYDSDIRKLLTWFHSLKEFIDFTTLVKVADESGEAEKIKSADTEDDKPKAKAPKTPKNTAPKTGTAPKANTKGVAGSKNTYRPKSV